MPFGKILYKVGMFENKMGKDNGSVSNTGNYIGTPWGIILCVDYYRDEKINGRIYHRYQTEPIRVGGMTEAVFEIDAFFDRLGYPFPTIECKSNDFRKPYDSYLYSHRTPSETWKENRVITEVC